ncbi:MAG: hypothetical protein JWO33_1807, partial [Caulobacteraceae bacterium]|nr:hypothetical protein [Caulobacteraceae bacterium]
MTAVSNVSAVQTPGLAAGAGAAAGVAGAQSAVAGFDALLAALFGGQADAAA